MQSCLNEATSCSGHANRGRTLPHPLLPPQRFAPASSAPAGREHHHRRAAQNKGRPPETSGPSAAMLRPVSMTSVRAAEGESNSACENTNSVRTRHTRNAPAAVPDAVEHSGLGRALTRAEGLRLRPVVSLSPRDNVRGPLVPAANLPPPLSALRNRGKRPFLSPRADEPRTRFRNTKI